MYISNTLNCRVITLFISIISTANASSTSPEGEADTTRRGILNLSVVTVFGHILTYGAFKKQCGIKMDSKMAFISLDSYLRTKSANQAGRPAYQTSSPESCESLGDEYPIMMNSPIEVKQEVSPPPVQSSENGKHPQTDDAASQILNSQDESMIINQTEYEEDTDMPEDDEVSISLSVGDGRYLVDLGSSSEFIIDEECILQLFKSCRECNRQCTVRKQVKGLKLTVSQKCCFCESSSKWTNLPDEDDDC